MARVLVLPWFVLATAFAAVRAGVACEDLAVRLDDAAAVLPNLVEVGAGADPPVCRILDWGKMKFEREKKARESAAQAARA